MYVHLKSKPFFWRNAYHSKSRPAKAKLIVKYTVNSHKITRWNPPGSSALRSQN